MARTEHREEEADVHEDEDTGAQGTLIVRLKEVAITTGEENKTPSSGDCQVSTGMTVQEHCGNEKSYLWHTADFSDGELKDELFCIRFASIENCKTFMEKFTEVAENQQVGKWSTEGNEAAGLLENLSVGDKKNEGKAKEEEEAESPSEEEQTETNKEKKTEVSTT